MLYNRTWDRPEDWMTFTQDTKNHWRKLADIYEKFYIDMRKGRHINTGLSKYACLFPLIY